MPPQMVTQRRTKATTRQGPKMARRAPRTMPAKGRRAKMTLPRRMQAPERETRLGTETLAPARMRPPRLGRLSPLQVPLRTRRPREPRYVQEQARVEHTVDREG